MGKWDKLLSERPRTGIARSETVTVRLDPRLRYLAELAARKQRRTLSSFVEWAIEDALERIPMGAWQDQGESVAEAGKTLWDVDEPDRLAKLALSYPDVLTHTEQRLWKLICENGAVWNGFFGRSGKYEWRVERDKLNLAALREHWDAFRKVAKGEAEKSTLPTWEAEAPF